MCYKHNNKIDLKKSSDSFWSRTLRLAEIFSREAGVFFRDPGEARNECIDLLRNPSAESVRRFFNSHLKESLSPEEQDKALALLEMARQNLSMKTSCAWFFDDIADREAIQVLCSAARAIQIAREQTGVDLEGAFRERLSAIAGNRPQFPDGGAVYRDCVLPRVLFPEGQAACIALMEATGKTAHVIHADGYSGEYLSCGELLPTHDLSLLGRPIRYCFMSSGTDSALLGLDPAGTPPGDHSGELLGVLLKKGYSAAAERLMTLFSRGISIEEFPPAGRRLVARSHLSRAGKAFEKAAGVLLEKHLSLEDPEPDPRFYPPWIVRLERYVLACRLEETLSLPGASMDDLRCLAEAFSDQGITATQGMQPSTNSLITRLMEDWVCHPGDRQRMEQVAEALALIRTIGAPYPAWHLQDLFISVRDGPALKWETGARAGAEEAVAWWGSFQALGRALGVCVPGGAGHPQP